MSRISRASSARFRPQQMRVCPACRRPTPHAYCAFDGAATEPHDGFGRDPLSYREGDVIAERYRITGALGRGGFGAVYAAEHVHTGQQLAVKLLTAAVSGGDQRHVERFHREAQVTASLTDPHTVRVFDLGRAEDGPFYLVMELLRGPTLDNVLRQLARQGRVMAAFDAIDLAIQVLHSLTEAHGAGLVHRDLKPANIILARVGANSQMVKVLDFGIARVADSSLTGSGGIIGTPHFMSPEQCRGLVADARSDLYSLGVILYLCVTGQLPFDGQQPLQLLMAHIQQVPVAPDRVAPHPLPPGLAEVIVATLAKAPEARPQSAVALRSALEALRSRPGASLPRASRRPAAPPVVQEDEEPPTLLLDAAELLAKLPGTPASHASAERGRLASIELAPRELVSLDLAASAAWDSAEHDRRLSGDGASFQALRATPEGFTAWLDAATGGATTVAPAARGDAAGVGLFGGRDAVVGATPPTTSRTARRKVLIRRAALATLVALTVVVWGAALGWF